MPAAGQDRVPSISVVMPVRNAMPHLDAAITSILDQTHTDFELVIGDDASSDGSSERLEWWAERDPRIRLMGREIPSGPAGSSNWVAFAARAPLIARMDADDVSHRERLARQFAVLADNPDASMVASTWIGIDAEGRTVRYPDVAGLVRFDRFKRPFAHGSVMMRRAAFERVGGYREQCDFWEDTDLFIRMPGEGDVLIMREPLYRYRYTTGSNRLHADQLRFERQLALQFACRTADRSGGGYEAVLAKHKQAPTGGHRVSDARVFQGRATIEAWAGTRSSALTDWLRRGRVAHLWRDRAAIAFLIWAFVEPRSLRAVLRSRSNLANRKAKTTLGGADFVRWAP